MFTFRHVESAVAVAGLAASIALAPAAVAATPRARANGDIVVVSTTYISQENPSLGIQRSLLFLRRDGTLERTLPVSLSIGWFGGTPDGRRLTFTQDDGIFTSDLFGQHQRLIVRTGSEPVWPPAWAPDGRHIAFTKHGSIWISGVDGRRQRRLTAGASPTWSPDGRTIAFLRARAAPPSRRCEAGGGSRVLYAVPVTGGPARRLYRPALRCPVISNPSWSPNGAELVAEIWDDTEVGAPADPRAPGLVGITLISAKGVRLRRLDHGTLPSWSPDGHEIVYYGYISGSTGKHCATAQDPGQTLCVISATGKNPSPRKIATVQDDGNFNFAPMWWLAR